MDKYEYEIKTEQIVKLIHRNDYKTAKKIADTIKWDKERDPRLLKMVAELYVQSEEYDEAIDLLLQAYEFTKTGRRIVYRLVEVAILAKRYQDAEAYCNEYHELAPGDQEYYLLRYKLAEAKGTERLDFRIRCLEQYLQDNMSEEWALRLAELYSEAGKVSECVRLCDDIIFWYCNGEYVIRAMELKMLYAPLNKRQQDKYDRREELMEAYRQEMERQRLAEEAANQEALERRKQKWQDFEEEDVNYQPRTDQEEENHVTIMLENTESELASEISNIVNPQSDEETEPEKETEADGTAMLAASEVAATVEEAMTEATVEKEEDIAVVAEEPVEQIEAAVQEELVVTADSKDIQEMLRRTAMKKTAAEPDEDDLRIFESVKMLMKGTEAANDSVIAAASGVTAAADLGNAAWNLPETQEIGQKEQKTEEVEPAKETGEISEPEAEMPMPEVEVEEIETVSEPEAEVLIPEVEEEKTEPISEPEAEVLIPEVEEEEPESVSEPKVEEKELESILEPEAEISTSEPETKELDISSVPAAIEEELKRQLGDMDETAPDSNEEADASVKAGSFAISAEDSAKGFQYAVELLKRIPKSEDRPTKLAKTTAPKLNESGLLISEDKLEDKLLLIEEAGAMNNEILNELLIYFRHHPTAIVIIIDTEENLQTLFGRSEELEEIFCLHYQYKDQTIEQWYELMQEYAKAKECVIAPSAEELIKAYLEDLQQHDELIFDVLLKEIVDDAVEEARNFSFLNLFAGAFNKKFNSDGMLILKARHF